uniref:Uncharacterized protein n=1 Tax=Tanacetum cinerariifolium TaxID=118510 RepID=A0A6L2NER7_TANCI|nr:hypothetical protein [Tanacetum cinerariifolium]
MSSITAQQNKLDLKLFPKEKRLEIRKCNGRLNPGKKQQVPTFQVVLDALALTPCYSAFLTTADVPENFNTGEIKSIIDVVVDQMHQPWRTFSTIINRSLYRKTTGLDKNHASPKLSTVPVSSEEPTRKSKRVKRPSKKSTKVPTAGVVIRETPLMSLSKKKEKVTVEKHKGIDLLSKVALTKKAQYKKACKKSLRDFHKTHPSGSGRDEDDNNNDHDSSNEGSDQESDSGDDNSQSDKEKGSDSEHETNENESGSKSDQEKNEEYVEDDEEENDDEFVKTPSNFTNDEDETNVEDKAEEITLNQVIEDAHVTLSTIAKKTEVPVTSSSHSSDLASKFLNFLDIPHIDAEIVSPMDVHVHHEVPSNQIPTLLTVPVSVITRSSPVFTTVISQSLPPFTSPPPQSRPTPPPTTKAINPLSVLPNFISVFQFNNKVTALEKERKTSKDNEPIKGLKAKESKSVSSKGTKSQSKSSGKFVHVEEPEFEVANSEMPQDQLKNLDDNDEEPKRNVVSKCDWFTNRNNLKNPLILIGILARLHNKDLLKAVTRVEVIQKHGYAYLREIELRRADDDLYIQGRRLPMTS